MDNKEQKKKYTLYVPAEVSNGQARVHEITTSSKEVALERANEGRELINMIDKLRSKKWELY